MPLFQVTSRFNGKQYDVNWDASGPLLRVSLGVSAFPPPAAPPAFPPPAAPPGFPPKASTPNNPSEAQICAFEEGRLSHPNEANPYALKKENADLATSWAFGVLCK